MISILPFIFGNEGIEFLLFLCLSVTRHFFYLRSHRSFSFQLQNNGEGCEGKLFGKKTSFSTGAGKIFCKTKA